MSAAAGATLPEALAAAAREIEATMAALLPERAGADPGDPPGAEGFEAPLMEAMRYASLGGGKRLRGFLVVETARLFGVPDASSLRVAAAVEFLHAYSLVHDDLPAMDDSDLRRGRPSCHKAFDEATAILAGDGLLTLAFEVVADPGTHEDAGVRAGLALALARAGGAEGMVGGQMIDLAAENRTLDVAGLTRLQRLKTGRLITFSCEAGAILGGAASEQRAALAGYAADIGLAFQIADDLLDAEGTTEALGKPAGQDAMAGKATFVSALGIAGARAHADALAARAESRLGCFGAGGHLLKEVARFVIDRKA